MRKNKISKPFALFGEYFARAGRSKKIADASAMCLATASKKGIPSSRMVLLKEWDERGFVFYTNLNSKKGRELKENPHASLCFYWEPIGIQVRIKGKVKEVSKKQADEYFATRPRKSRIGAWASKQSEIMNGKKELLTRVAEAAARFGMGNVPRPEYWSGLRVIPTEIEFWQHGSFRLHTRSRFIKKGKIWEEKKLFP